MRRDLIIGFFVSILIHGGALFGNKLLPKWEEKKKIEAPKTTIDLIEMPRIEPDEPDKAPEPQDDVKIDYTPPTQIDTPQVVTTNDFTQQMQPPPPDNLNLGGSIINIPGDRDNSRFKGMEVFDVSKLDQIPEPKFRANPQYPFDMRRAGISGNVLVDFIVDTDGVVQNAYAISSSQREFEANAVQAVSKWSFRPGRKGGRAVNTHMQVPIVFTLNDN